MSGVPWKFVRDEYTLTTNEVAIAQIIAASNHAVMITSVLLEFDDFAETHTKVGQITLLYHTDGGNTPVASNPFITDDSTETLEVTGSKSWAADPAHGNIIVRKNFKMSANTQPVSFTFSDRVKSPTTSGNSYTGPPLKIPGGSRFGVEIFGPAGVSASTCLLTIVGNE